MLSIREQVDTHVAACRAAMFAGQPRPAWSGDNLRSTNLSGADLSGADLRSVDFRNTNLRGADLSGADLSGADLCGARLIGARIAGARLTRADLTRADLRGAGLAGSDLTGSDLRRTDLRSADLRYADLTGADLIGARIAEGVVTASVAGETGGYHWHALALADGGGILQYGCDRAALTEWRLRGPEYGRRHGHEWDHWATGPAIAIAAAETLLKN